MEYSTIDKNTFDKKIEKVQFWAILFLATKHRTISRNIHKSYYAVFAAVNEHRES